MQSSDAVYNIQHKFDELSMMNGTKIGDISDCLKKVKNTYRGELCSYFGGYTVVVLGNFDQLPTVTGSALYKDLLRIENIKDTPTKSKMTNALSLIIPDTRVCVLFRS